MVSVLDSGSSGPGSGPGWGHCVVFLGKTVYSHSASLHQVYKWVPANSRLGVTLQWASIPSRESRNTPCPFMLRKPGISSGVLGHLARKALTYLTYI